MNPFDFLSGYKTYIGGIGLIGLAVYQASQQDYQHAYQSFLTGWTVLAARHAIAKTDAKVDSAIDPFNPTK